MGSCRRPKFPKALSRSRDTLVSGMLSVKRWMSKWLSTIITLIANSLHRNRSFWTERKNFIVWVKRTHVDRLLERTRARILEKYSPTHFKSDIGDVKGTSALERQSNVHSYKRGMFDHCFDSVFISSLRKVVVFVASFCPTIPTCLKMKLLFKCQSNSG